MKKIISVILCVVISVFVFAGCFSTVAENAAAPQSQSETVYWVPNGKVYHTTPDCPTLSRSKTILDGSVEDSGKPRVCKKCG